MDVCTENGEKSSIRHNTFTQNIATAFGSVILIKDSGVKFSNIHCFNNSNIHGTAEDNGTFSTFRSNVTFPETKSFLIILALESYLIQKSENWRLSQFRKY